MNAFRIAAGVSVAAALFWGAFTNAQVSGAETEPESADVEAPPEVIEEIRVIAGPQGETPFELEMQRQAAMREAIYADLRLRERHDSELAWRRKDPDLKKSESRIKWGYSAQAEQRMRLQNDFMHDLSIDRVKPATLFRVDF